MACGGCRHARARRGHPRLCGPRSTIRNTSRTERPAADCLLHAMWRQSDDAAQHGAAGRAVPGRAGLRGGRGPGQTRSRDRYLFLTTCGRNVICFRHDAPSEKRTPPLDSEHVDDHLSSPVSGAAVSAPLQGAPRSKSWMPGCAGHDRRQILPLRSSADGRRTDVALRRRAKARCMQPACGIRRLGCYGCNVGATPTLTFPCTGTRARRASRSGRTRDRRP
jgi:hypothetical protein